jgi:hypothetical protein
MEKPNFDIDKLRGMIWGNNQLVAKHVGISDELLLRKLKIGDFTIEELEKIGKALDRDIGDFVSTGEES